MNQSIRCTDRLCTFQMASNAYYGNPNEKGWLELGDEWSNTVRMIELRPRARINSTRLSL